MGRILLTNTAAHFTMSRVARSSRLDGIGNNILLFRRQGTNSRR
jgi:hypothetical protein